MRPPRNRLLITGLSGPIPERHQPLRRPAQGNRLDAPAPDGVVPEWLALDDDALILRKCAYWASLRDAKPSTNATGQTVYLPKNQRFDPAGLLALMTRLSHNDIPRYQELTE
jgi:hypothetical protein